MREWPYWLFVALLLAVGFVSILSIGAPFLLLGVTLALLAPYRRRPRVFWPWLLGVLGFIAGYISVAPLSCLTAASRFGATTENAYTTCSSALGIRYSGGVGYSPPLWPAFLAGLAVGFSLYLTTRFAATNRKRNREELRSKEATKQRHSME